MFCEMMPFHRLDLKMCIAIILVVGVMCKVCAGEETYIYQLSSTSITSIPQSSKGYDKILISASIETQYQTDCRIVLQVKDGKMRQQSVPKEGKAEDLEVNSIVTEDPVAIDICKGKIGNFTVSQNDFENKNSLNIKRAILSQLQINPSQWFSPENLRETDIHGDCDTSYIPDMDSPSTFRKIKILASCKGATNLNSHLLMSSYNSPRVNSGSMLDSKYECKSRLDENKRVFKSNCTETHYHEYPKDGYGFKTYITQSLLLATKTDKPKIKMSANRIVPIQFDHLSENDMIRQKRTPLDTLVKNICSAKDKFAAQKNTAKYFAELLDHMKSWDYETIRKQSDILNNCGAGWLFRDALFTQKTASATKFLASEKVQSSKNENDPFDNKLMWLTQLALQPNPTPQVVEGLLSVLKKANKEDKLTSVLVGAVVYNYRKSIGFGVLPKSVKDVIIEITKPVKAACAAGVSDPDSVQAKQLITGLRAMGNMGGGGDFGSVLKKCANQRNLPIEARVLMIQAFRRTGKDLMKTRMEILFPIFTSKNGSVELRNNAFLMIANCPCGKAVDIIINTLQSEQYTQVGAFMWSHLRNILVGQASDPWTLKLRKLLYKRDIGKKFSQASWLTSWNYENAYYSNAIKAGVRIGSNVIYVPESMTPRSVQSNINLESFGKVIDFVQVGLRSQNELDGLTIDRIDPTRRENVDIGGGRTPSDSEHKREKHHKKMDKNKSDKRKFSSMYIRVGGTELAYVETNNIVKYLASLQLLKKTVAEKIQQLSRLRVNLLLADTDLVYPTLMGFPLRLSVKSTLSGSFGFQFKTSVIWTSGVKANIHVSPSVSMWKNIKLALIPPKTESGFGKQYTSYTSFSKSLDANAEINLAAKSLNSFELKYKPQAKSVVFDIQSQFWMYSGQNSVTLHQVQSKQGGDNGKPKKFCWNKSDSFLAIMPSACLQYTTTVGNAGGSLPYGGPGQLSLVLEHKYTDYAIVLKNSQSDGELMLSLKASNPDNKKGYGSSFSYKYKGTSIAEAGYQRKISFQVDTGKEYPLVEWKGEIQRSSATDYPITARLSRKTLGKELLDFKIRSTFKIEKLSDGPSYLFAFKSTQPWLDEIGKTKGYLVGNVKAGLGKGNVLFDFETGFAKKKIESYSQSYYGLKGKIVLRRNYVVKLATRDGTIPINSTTVNVEFSTRERNNAASRLFKFGLDFFSDKYFMVRKTDLTFKVSNSASGKKGSAKVTNSYQLTGSLGPIKGSGREDIKLLLESAMERGTSVSGIKISANINVKPKANDYRFSSQISFPSANSRNKTITADGSVLWMINPMSKQVAFNVDLYNKGTNKRFKTELEFQSVGIKTIGITSKVVSPYVGHEMRLHHEITLPKQSVMTVKIPFKTSNQSLFIKIPDLKFTFLASHWSKISWLTSKCRSICSKHAVNYDIKHPKVGPLSGAITADMTAGTVNGRSGVQGNGKVVYQGKNVAQFKIASSKYKQTKMNFEKELKRQNRKYNTWVQDVNITTSISKTNKKYATYFRLDVISRLYIAILFKTEYSKGLIDARLIGRSPGLKVRGVLNPKIDFSISSTHDNKPVQVSLFGELTQKNKRLSLELNSKSLIRKNGFNAQLKHTCTLGGAFKSNTKLYFRLRGKQQMSLLIVDKTDVSDVKTLKNFLFQSMTNITYNSTNGTYNSTFQLGSEGLLKWNLGDRAAAFRSVLTTKSPESRKYYIDSSAIFTKKGKLLANIQWNDTLGCAGLKSNWDILSKFNAIVTYPKASGEPFTVLEIVGINDDSTLPTDILKNGRINPNLKYAARLDISSDIFPKNQIRFRLDSEQQKQKPIVFAVQQINKEGEKIVREIQLKLTTFGATSVELSAAFRNRTQSVVEGVLKISYLGNFSSTLFSLKNVLILKYKGNVVAKTRVDVDLRPNTKFRLNRMYIGFSSDALKVSICEFQVQMHYDSARIKPKLLAVSTACVLPGHKGIFNINTTIADNLIPSSVNTDGNYTGVIYSGDKPNNVQGRSRIFINKEGIKANVTIQNNSTLVWRSQVDLPMSYIKPNTQHYVRIFVAPKGNKMFKLNTNFYRNMKMGMFNLSYDIPSMKSALNTGTIAISGIVDKNYTSKFRDYGEKYIGCGLSTSFTSMNIKVRNIIWLAAKGTKQKTLGIYLYLKNNKSEPLILKVKATGTKPGMPDAASGQIGSTKFEVLKDKNSTFNVAIGGKTKKAWLRMSSENVKGSLPFYWLMSQYYDGRPGRIRFDMNFDSGFKEVGSEMKLYDKLQQLGAIDLKYKKGKNLNFNVRFNDIKYIAKNFSLQFDAGLTNGIKHKVKVVLDDYKKSYLFEENLVFSLGSTKSGKYDQGELKSNITWSVSQRKHMFTLNMMNVRLEQFRYASEYSSPENDKYALTLAYNNKTSILTIGSKIGKKYPEFMLNTNCLGNIRSAYVAKKIERLWSEFFISLKLDLNSTYYVNWTKVNTPHIRRLLDFGTPFRQGMVEIFMNNTTQKLIIVWNKAKKQRVSFMIDSGIQPAKGFSNAYFVQVELPLRMVKLYTANVYYNDMTEMETHHMLGNMPLKLFYYIKGIGLPRDTSQMNLSKTRDTLKDISLNIMADTYVMKPMAVEINIKRRMATDAITARLGSAKLHSYVILDELANFTAGFMEGTNTFRAKASLTPLGLEYILTIKENLSSDELFSELVFEVRNFKKQISLEKKVLSFRAYYASEDTIQLKACILGDNYTVNFIGRNLRTYPYVAIEVNDHTTGIKKLLWFTSLETDYNRQGLRLTTSYNAYLPEQKLVASKISIPTTPARRILTVYTVSKNKESRILWGDMTTNSSFVSKITIRYYIDGKDDTIMTFRTNTVRFARRVSDGIILKLRDLTTLKSWNKKLKGDIRETVQDYSVTEAWAEIMEMDGNIQESMKVLQTAYSNNEFYMKTLVDAKDNIILAFVNFTKYTKPIFMKFQPRFFEIRTAVMKRLGEFFQSSQKSISLWSAEMWKMAKFGKLLEPLNSFFGMVRDRFMVVQNFIQDKISGFKFDWISLPSRDILYKWFGDPQVMVDFIKDQASRFWDNIDPGYKKNVAEFFTRASLVDTVKQHFVQPSIAFFNDISKQVQKVNDYLSIQRNEDYSPFSLLLDILRGQFSDALSKFIRPDVFRFKAFTANEKLKIYGVDAQFYTPIPLRFLHDITLKDFLDIMKSSEFMYKYSRSSPYELVRQFYESRQKMQSAWDAGWMGFLRSQPGDAWLIMNSRQNEATIHARTFDKRFFSFVGSPGPSVYLLSHENRYSNFTLYMKTGQGITPGYLLLAAHRTYYKFTEEGKLYIDRKLQKVLVNRTEDGITVTGQSGKLVFDMRGIMSIAVYFDKWLTIPYLQRATLFRIKLNKWYHGDAAGLLGKFDYEPGNDFTGPDRKTVDSMLDFIQSWSVGRSPSLIRTMRMGTLKEINTQNYVNESAKAVMKSATFICELAFGEYSGAAKYVSVKPYLDECKRHMYFSSAPAYTQYLCPILKHYGLVAKAYGVKVRLPAKCVIGQCRSIKPEYYDKVKSREAYTRVSTSTRILFAVENSRCLEKKAEKAFITSSLWKTFIKYYKKIADKPDIASTKFGLIGFDGQKANAISLNYPFFMGKKDAAADAFKNLRSPSKGAAMFRTNSKAFLQAIVNYPFSNFGHGPSYVIMTVCDTNLLKALTPTMIKRITDANIWLFIMDYSKTNRQKQRKLKTIVKNSKIGQYEVVKKKRRAVRSKALIIKAARSALRYKKNYQKRRNVCQCAINQSTYDYFYKCAVRK